MRAAIQEANALVGADTISLPAGTYLLTRTGTGENAASTGDLDITQALTINGASDGGGIYIDSGLASLTNVTISGNTTNGASNITISSNPIFENGGYGIDLLTGPNTNNVITGNTIRNNGFTTGNQDGGIGLRVATNTTSSNNTITANQGDGIVVSNAAGNTGNRFTQNSIFTNGELGIDLGGATQGDGVTLNDSGDGDTGANDFLNYPVIQAAQISGGNLTVTGFARPGSIIEFFIAAPDATGFGEGQTYLVT